MTRSAGGRGGVADRVRPHRRRPRPLHRRLRAGRGHRAGGARRGAGLLAARRRAAQPAGWLLTVGRRRAIDAFRRRAALDERYAVLARPIWTRAGATSVPDGRDAGRRRTGLLFDPDRIDDDVLALMFIACHPVLSREAQRRADPAGGRRPDQRRDRPGVPRADRRPCRRGSPAPRRRSPPRRCRSRCRRPDERRERLGSVLSVLYLIFTEGSTASAGSDWIRPDLAREAIRLARVLVRLVPDEPEAHGLLALLELTAARFPARPGRRRRAGAARGPGPSAVGPGGDPARPRGPGRRRPGRPRPGCLRPAGLDRRVSRGRAVGRGDGLGADRPPVRGPRPAGAVARSSSSTARSRSRWPSGPAAALPIVDDLVAAGSLSGSHLLPSVRGELLSRLGKLDEARPEIELAVRLCGNERERSLLQRKLAALA